MDDQGTTQTEKESAVNFLQLVVAGEIDEAYEKYVDMQEVHHNVYYPAGFSVLKQGMKKNNEQFPDKQIRIKNVIAEDDLVAVHSNIMMKAGEAGIAVVHIFRFQEGKIVEMWDIGQPILDDLPNQAGAF